MEDEKKKKGAFSFLRSLGFLGKQKDVQAKPVNAPADGKKRNQFAVDNVQQDLNKRKKVLEGIK